MVNGVCQGLSSVRKLNKKGGVATKEPKNM